MMPAFRNGLARALMQANWGKYLDRRLPRYTSYPTAVQFGAAVDAAAYESWLAALPAEAPVSLYLHVPFCAELCLYCACHTTVARRDAPVAAYARLLEREIALIGARLAGQDVTHIHFGGGTPTMLQPKALQRIMTTLHAQFQVTPVTEIAIEIDPRTLSREHVAALADIGVGRASLGVQDFAPRVQEAIGRRQSLEQTARVADRLRDAGIVHINLDLMYGLPQQTVASVIDTAEQALSLRPDRIALFGYAHVPWMKRHQSLIPEDTLPGSSERFAQSKAAAEVFVGAGFQQVGLDHFARADDPLAERQRAGRLHRNFQGYTTDETTNLIGFGPSAIGSLPGGYVQNAPQMIAYREAIIAGRPATARGCALTAEDRLRGRIIERLMCDLRIDLDAACGAHGQSAERFSAEFSALDALALDGLVVRNGSKIRIPPEARAFVRSVCAVFDQYAPQQDARYSRAC
jgi:oxygen-independent coproporphyrinogen III oxidase